MASEPQQPMPYVDDRDARPLDAAELLEEFERWQRAQAELAQRRAQADGHRPGASRSR